MAYKYVTPGINPNIRYVGTGDKPTVADAGARLLDVADSSHFIWSGTECVTYKDASLYTA